MRHGRPALRRCRSAGPGPSPSRARSGPGATRTGGTADSPGPTCSRRRSSWRMASRPAPPGAPRSSAPPACSAPTPTGHGPSGPTGAHGVSANGCPCRLWRARCAGWRPRGPTTPTRAPSPGRRPATWKAPGRRCGAADLAAHASTWGDPIRVTYRGVEATSHPPNSSGAVALELLQILAAFDPPAPSAFGSHGVTDARWVHLALEAARLAIADRDAYLTDPEAMAEAALGMLLDPRRAAELAGRIDPVRAIATAPARGAPGRRHRLPRRRRLGGRRGQPHRVELRRLRLRPGGPGHRHRLPEPGRVLLARPAATRTRSRRASGPCTR